jgi:hypothetical protein
MLAYAGRRGAGDKASAIVAQDNIASQRMMEKNGFAAISRWAYYGIDDKKKKLLAGSKMKTSSTARLANVGDLDPAWRYLRSSAIYNGSAAGRYVKAWQWYPLDRKTLRKLVLLKRIVVLPADTSNSAIDGLMVINADGYWDRQDVLQVVYLDSRDGDSARPLLSFAAQLYDGGDTAAKYSHLHIICPRERHIESAVESMFETDKSEQFLLYAKNNNNKSSSKDFTA